MLTDVKPAIINVNRNRIRLWERHSRCSATAEASCSIDFPSNSVSHLGTSRSRRWMVV